MKESSKQELLGLLTAKKDIKQFLHNTEPLLAAIHMSKSVSLDSLFSLSENAMLTTHAPIGWKVGDPLIDGHPPAPLPEEMRSGHLERFHLLNNIGSNMAAGVSTTVCDFITTNSFIDTISAEQTTVQTIKSSSIEVNKKRKSDEVTLASSAIEEKTKEESLKQSQSQLAASEVLLSKTKTSRPLNISFGISDSESGEDESLGYDSET